MNGSVDNVTTELGGRIIFRCNDGFLPSEVMTAVCQTTGWSQDPALLECFPRGTLYTCFIDNCNIYALPLIHKSFTLADKTLALPLKL